MKPKYRVRLLFDVHGWAYHRRCLALQKHAPDDIEVSIGGVYGAAFREASMRNKPIDLVLQLCYDSTDQLSRHISKGGYDMVLVSGLNVSSASAKGYLEKQQQFANWTVFNSKMAWGELDRPERTSYISNGIDREDFFPLRNPQFRKPKVISIGSKFHRANKGFTNILVEVEKRLHAEGIECDFRCVDSHGKGRMNTEEIAKWYNTGTIYLVASQREGTPNPALEAAACGCVLVATRVGNMPELIRDGVNGRLVSRDVDSIVEGILDVNNRRKEMWAEMERAIGPWSWAVRSTEYWDLFRRLIDDRRERENCPPRG